MKRAIILFVLFLIVTHVFSQAPEKISYQAVIRDIDNNLLKNQLIGMQISILHGSLTGNPVYIETQTPITNINGLVTIEIGTGTTTDDFTGIDWEAGPYYIKTETDPSADGGTNYTITGTSQILSVPYALHSKTVEFNDDDDADPANELQVLTISNDTLFLSDGGYIKLPQSNTQCNDLLIVYEKGNITCFNAGNGWIDLTVSGGTYPYSFNWSNGDLTEDISNLPPEKYSIIVTDKKGYTAFQQITISEPDKLNLDFSVNNVTITGGSDGAIDLTVTGGTPPYDFEWSNGNTTEDISGIPMGKYIISVTDSNDCFVSDSTVVIEPIELSFNVTNPTCYGYSNGAIDMTLSGGQEPYTFFWSNEESTEDINSLLAGSYRVQVTDSYGSVAVDTIELISPALIGIETSITHETMSGNDGAIDVTVSNGIAPYTYLWSNSATTEDINSLSFGGYSVYVTDNNGCAIESDSIYIYGLSALKLLIMMAIYTRV